MLQKKKKREYALDFLWGAPYEGKHLYNKSLLE